MDSAGSVFFSDHTHIRKLSPNGIVSTLVTGRSGKYSGEGGLASLADFSGAMGVAVDGAGNVYVADPSNSAVHVLRPAKPLDLKSGYWDVTEHIATFTAELQAAYDQQLAAAAQYPPASRPAYIAAIKESQQQAAKGVDTKGGICVTSDHPLQSLLLGSGVQSSLYASNGEPCTTHTGLSSQKLTVHSICSDGTEQSYVVERIDSVHFRGSLDSHAKDPRNARPNKTFSGAWARSSCLPAAPQ